MVNMKKKEIKKRQKPKSALKTTKRLLLYFAEYKFKSILVIFFIIINAVVGVVGSMFLETLVDDYITPLMLEASPVFSGLLKAILFMGFIYILGICASLFYNRIMVGVSQGILKKIRDDMFFHMESLPIKYFDTHSHGNIMSRYTNDTDTLRQMLSQSVPQVFSSVITIVSVLAGMIATSAHLTLLMGISIVSMTFVTKIVGGKSAKYFIKQQESVGETNGYIEEIINGQKVVKVFSHEEKAKEKFDELNQKLRDNSTQANKFANIFMPIMGNIGNIQYVIIAFAGGAMAISGIGGITLGAIASFLQLTRSFIMPVSQVSQQINAVVMALAGAERIFELMDEESECDEGYVSLINVKEDSEEIIETKEHTGHWAWKHPHKDGTISYTKLKGEVVFYDVDFGYNQKTVVLHNINMHAMVGQKLAFVGSTGAGKTTITNLINRFYDIADGKIRYDGININKIKKKDLRRSLGMVLQDTNLFSGTVMENIRYGRLDATDEEIYAAAKLANAHGFIERLPKGYQTMLEGDGGRLSQGQRQLISIARAAIADLPVMILDEATSSIDTRTEAIVQRGMDALMKGRTVFVIAHRLSTVKNSDVIMVLEDGVIIERGGHDDLVAKEGKYYQLYTGAFEMQ